MDGTTRIVLLNKVNFLINYMLPDLPSHYHKGSWRERLTEIRDIIERTKSDEA